MSRRERPTRPAPPPGLLVVDKPDGMTSHDVVAKVRRILGTRKVGHAGTLDPMATGVLVLGIERATKLLGHLSLDRKAYLGTIRLGSATDTDDAEGQTVHTGTDRLGEATTAAIAEVIGSLTGRIEQVPSAVSAVKVDGKRAYERARAGEHVELQPRPVTVHRFDVLAERHEADAIDLDVLVECSSGTYVRALARDLGDRLNVGGHLAALRRTKVGPFDLAAARTLDQLAEHPELSFDLDSAVATAFGRRDVSAAEARAVGHGQRLPAAGFDGAYGVFGPDGRVLALAEDSAGVAKLLTVLV